MSFLRRLKTFIINSIILTSSSFALRLITTAFSIYLSSKISQEALGVFHLIMSVYTFGITLAASGINLATTRVVSEELEYGNDSGVKKAAKRCILLSLCVSILSGFIFFINADLITQKFLRSKVSNNIIYLISFALPMISVCSSFTGYFTAVRRAYKNAIGLFVEQFTKIIATIYLLNLYFPIEIEYACFALILGDLISEIVAFLFNYIMYKFDIKRYNNFNHVRTGNYLKRIAKISFPVAITSYIKSGLSTFKHLSIPSRLEKSGMSYSASLSGYGMINGMVMPLILFPSLFITSFSNLLVPEFSRYYIKKDFKRIKQVSKYILIISTVFSLFLTAFLFFFADKLGIIFYDNADIGKYIKIMCPLVLFMYVDTVVDSILKGLNAQVGIMLVNILDLIVTISIIFLFIPRTGMFGYILSIFVSEILNFTISLMHLIKIIKKAENS